MKDEIIIYQADEASTRLEVRIEEETVWLTQAQMAELFQASPQNITIHIRNIFKEGELTEKGTCKDYLQVQNEGGRRVKRSLSLYNLDIIISIGYRVKSFRGTQFRIWANRIPAAAPTAAAPTAAAPIAAAPAAAARRCRT